MDIEEGIRIINYVANQVHMRHISVGFGIILTFIEKSEEAADYIAAGYPKNLESWPFIHAESHATGKTPHKVADDIIKLKSDWRAIAVQVEEIRLSAIIKIKKARANIQKEVDSAIEKFDLL